MKSGLGMVMGAVWLLAACGSGPASEQGLDEGSAIQLNLSTVGASGTEYRLAPASFDLVNLYTQATTSVSADGAEAALHVPLEPATYRVKLNEGWALSRVEGTTLVRVLATLTSPVQSEVSVRQFETTPVNFAFHLGEASIDIGVTVDEGIPPGYDARLVPQPWSSPPTYYLEWRGGFTACCYSSLAEAQAAYGHLNIYLAP